MADYCADLTLVALLPGFVCQPQVARTTLVRKQKIEQKNKVANATLLINLEYHRTYFAPFEVVSASYFALMAASSCNAFLTAL